MKKETKEKLDSLMEQYAKGMQANDAIAQRRQRESEEFEAQIAKLQNEVIIPLMNEIGQTLIQGGHSCEVDKTNAGPQFRICPSGTNQNHEMLFRTDSKKRVLVEIKPRPNEARIFVAEVPVKQMTAERVEDEILKFVSGALRKK